MNKIAHQCVFCTISKQDKLDFRIKVQRRALVLIPCLILCNRCEKSAKESRNSHHLIMQHDKIHARTYDTCVDQRGYMTSGRRNLF